MVKLICSIDLAAMEPNRLNREELEYELSVRGTENTHILTIPVMRSELSRKLKKEELGFIEDRSNTPRDPAKEIEVCNQKIIEMQQLSDEYINSNEYKKIFSKLLHVNGRLARITSDKEEITDRIVQLQKEISKFEENLVEKYDQIEEAVFQGTDTPVVSQNSIKPSKQIPVSQWKISFSGDYNGPSVNAFLEQVNEYSISRNVSKSDLCNSAVELLTGRALIWYRSVRSQIKSWDEFVRLLRAEYEPHDYELELWDEIRSRTQGPDETVSSYFACMINLFARLPMEPSERQKLQVLQRNIAPDFIRGLGLIKVETVEELRGLCKQLESNRIIAEKFKPPPSNRRNLLEPDLAYQSRSRTTAAHTSEVQSTIRTNPTSNQRCWNCQAAGHYYTNCRRPRNKFCYGCGTRNHTKSTCPKCKSSRKGN